MFARTRFQTRKPPRAGRPAWKCAEGFKRWLRKLPCACCGKAAGDLRNPIVVAHVDHAGGKGMATKTADSNSIPLCDVCHQEQHRVGWLTFEKKLQGADAVVLATIYWTEWPDRFQWERDLAAAGEAPR